jgi:hypothetical protein
MGMEVGGDAAGVASWVKWKLQGVEWGGVGWNVHNNEVRKTKDKGLKIKGRGRGGGLEGGASLFHRCMWARVSAVERNKGCSLRNKARRTVGGKERVQRADVEGGGRGVAYAQVQGSVAVGAYSALLQFDS